MTLMEMCIRDRPYAPAFDENGKILSPDDGPSRHNVLLNIDEALNETRY